MKEGKWEYKLKEEVGNRLIFDDENDLPYFTYVIAIIPF